MRSFGFCLTASLILAGCLGSGSLERRVLHLEARSPDCDLRYEYVDPTNGNAMIGYRQVAVISLREAPETWTAELRQRLQPLACRAGGDAVGYLRPPGERPVFLVLSDTPPAASR